MKIRPMQNVTTLTPPRRRAYVDALKRAYAAGTLELDLSPTELPQRLLDALFPAPSPQRA